ncbi:MAG: N-acetylmuramoyl-L-alanine amidase, partial [Candidatus Omnitrophica bacterium]|nr:N-acetylmuramoyl-L-alanine amidase [Candidatus Omnitrophota bacterium]
MKSERLADGLCKSLVLTLLISGCVGPFPRSTAPLRSPPDATGAFLARPIRTIVIDTGHGGHDPGTSHHGLKEKYLALDIAKRLRARLQEKGINVVMTRETDRFLPLSARPAIANRLSADLFVSIHINANHSSRISGIEVYYPRTSVVSAKAQWPPSVSPTEVGVPSTTIKQILWDLVLRKTRLQSRRLAVSV